MPVIVLSLTHSNARGAVCWDDLSCGVAVSLSPHMSGARYRHGEIIDIARYAVRYVAGHVCCDAHEARRCVGGTIKLIA